MAISQIPALPDRERRFEELFVDTYDVYEEFGGMGVYLADCLTFPFEAIWRDEERSADHDGDGDRQRN